MLTLAVNHHGRVKETHAANLKTAESLFEVTESDSVECCSVILIVHANMRVGKYACVRGVSMLLLPKSTVCDSTCVVFRWRKVKTRC